VCVCCVLEEYRRGRDAGILQYPQSALSYKTKGSLLNFFERVFKSPREL
jgi:hypothetical protein